MPSPIRRFTREQLIAGVPAANELDPASFELLLKIAENTSELAVGIANLLTWRKYTVHFELPALTPETGQTPIIKTSRLVRHLPEDWTDERIDNLLWATLQYACEDNDTKT